MPSGTPAKVRAILNDFSTLHAALQSVSHPLTPEETERNDTSLIETSQSSGIWYKAAQNFLCRVEQLKALQRVNELVKTFVYYTQQDKKDFELAGSTLWDLSSPVSTNDELDNNITQCRFHQRPAQVQAVFGGIDTAALREIALGEPESVRFEIGGMLSTAGGLEFENAHKLIELDRVSSGAPTDYKGPIPRFSQIGKVTDGEDDSFIE